MTPAPSDPFFNVGALLAASRLGVDRNELLQKQARAEVMESKEAVPFLRELCKIAYVAFETDEDAYCPEAILFHNLAKSAEWHSSYNRFTDCVLRALAKQNPPAHMEKEASMLLPAVATLHDKAGGGIMKTLTAGGALGGAALGSLAFLLSRNAQQSSAENSMLLEKIKAYKQLKRDIQEDMASQDVMNTEEDSNEYRYDV